VCCSVIEELKKLEHCQDIFKFSPDKDYTPLICVVTKSAYFLWEQCASDTVLVPLPDLRNPVLKPLLVSEVGVPYFSFVILLHRVDSDVLRK